MWGEKLGREECLETNQSGNIETRKLWLKKKNEGKSRH